MFTTPERSRLMSKVRQSGTNAELIVRTMVRRCGGTYEYKSDELPGRPDMVDLKHKHAIFVHGCFWHAHEKCERWRLPKSNRGFWTNKFKANRLRDKRVLRNLKALGFSTLTVWECELDNRKRLEESIRRFLSTSSEPMALGSLKSSREKQV